MCPGAGWMVPLWKSEFRHLKVSTEDSPAAIYPQPHVAMVCAGRDGQEHEQEVRYPENLIFFASTRFGEADDTDAWAVTEGIDWADEAWPMVYSTGGSGSQPFDATLAAPVTAPAEHGRFVLELIRGQAVAVAHGYDEQSPLAGIDSITVSRASPLPEPASASGKAPAAHVVLPALDEVRTIVGDARSVASRLASELRAVPIKDLSDKARAELTRRADEAKAALGSIGEAARALAAGTDSARDRLDALVPSELLAHGCSEVKQLLASAVSTRLASATDELARFGARLEAVLSDLDARLQSADGALADKLSAAASSFDEPFVLAFATLDRLEFAGLEAGAQLSNRLTAVRDETVRMFGLFRQLARGPGAGSRGYRRSADPGSDHRNSSGRRISETNALRSPTAFGRCGLRSRGPSIS